MVNSSTPNQSPKRLQGWHMDEPNVYIQSSSENSEISNDILTQEESSTNYATDFIIAGVLLAISLVFAVMIYSTDINDNGLLFALTWFTFGAIYLLPIITGIVALFFFIKGAVRLMGNEN